MSFDITPFLAGGDPWPGKIDPVETVKRIYAEKYELAKTLPAPKTVLEIGVRAGYSAAVWLSVWPECRYHGLDSDGHESGGWPGAVHKARTMLGKHFPGRWLMTVYDTQTYPGYLPQGPCDLVYVDGDHSYQGCLHDLKAAAKIARRIWVDDLKHHAGTVGRAVEEFLKDPRVKKHTRHDTVRGDVVIEMDRNVLWSSGGDWGDTLAQLRTIRAFGPAVLTLAKRPTRRPYTPELVDEVYRPFLERQPYLTQVLGEERPEAIDLDLWRSMPLPKLSLADCVAAVFNAPCDSSPWLSCDEPNPVADVVINRTARYRSEAGGMWRAVMTKYRDKVFVGLEDEWRDFCAEFGDVAWHPTKDFWEVARVVSGARLVCCNQSSVYWLASGLGVPTVLEVDRSIDNCRLDRPNATYYDPPAGEPLTLPEIAPGMTVSVRVRVNGEEVTGAVSG